jgi:hypothetical protein
VTAETLSVREAYLAMYAFLERQRDQTSSDDLGALLGSMSLLPDGGTADPALWGEWLEDVARARREAVKPALGLRPGAHR